MMPGGESTGVVMPALLVGYPVGIPMLPTVSQLLIRAVVDTHLHLPDMFELTFLDNAGTFLDDAGIKIGSVIEVKGNKAGTPAATSLIKGEVTAVEALCQDSMILTVVRGYEKAHRLQRAKRTRTFVNMKDSDIARQIAKDAGLRSGTIDATSTTHDHLAQIAQTDWEFLTERAREVGYETGVVGGEFFFRKASGSGAGGGLMDAAASMVGLGSTLTFKGNLRTFLPRISAANLTPDVEVRVWDTKAARVAVGKSAAETGSVKIDGQKPAALANSFTDGLALPVALPAPPAIPGMPALNLGTAPSNTAYVVVDRPLARGPNADTVAGIVAKSLADHVSSTFAEAEGDAEGDPEIQAGGTVTIAGVPKQFAGQWVVTNARHVFDPLEGGYHTRFWVSGRQDRSLLRLTGGAARRPPLDGLVCALVTNVKDPDKAARVKVAMPWLSPNYESDWARVAQVGAGRRSGVMFVPEVGDEVLVGFEFGDPRRPYVLGGLINDNSAFGHLKTAVNGSGVVTERGLASPAGNRLLFTDELPPGPPGSAPPTKSEVVVGTKDDKLSLHIDQAAGTVKLVCDPAKPVSKGQGELTIECGAMGSITIKAGMGGIKLETTGALSLKGKTVKVEADMVTEIKGQTVKLN
ncbi:VgrG protein [Alloactinosynnema sp. L-07]|nr:VgrG protein [Alloactinosynnema sp. L-07]